MTKTLQVCGTRRNTREKRSIQVSLIRAPEYSVTKRSSIPNLCVVPAASTTFPGKVCSQHRSVRDTQTSRSSIGRKHVKHTVLIVEDTSTPRRDLQTFLRPCYKVILIESNRFSMSTITRHQPDLVILDHLHTCTSIRDYFPLIALVFLSSNADEKRIVAALDAGADDYIVSPYSAQELKARLRALLRRVPLSGGSSHQPDPASLQSEDGYLVLDKGTHRAYAGGKRVALTPTEFALVWQLLLHAGRVLPHRSLLQAVWGPEYTHEADYLRVYMWNIRRKIEEKPSTPCYIYTQQRVGYVLRSPSRSQSSE